MKQSIYHYFPRPELVSRLWPDNRIQTAPTWCSVDLTQGNNALSKPLSFDKKCHLFTVLCQLGFKQIEVASPAQSQEEFDFVRHLIQSEMIPEDVTISVASQIKESDIKLCFSAIKDASHATLHLFHSTTQLSRESVFGFNTDDIIQRAAKGFSLAVEEAKQLTDSQLSFEYTPEGFNTTEPDLINAIVEKIYLLVKPSCENKLIINMDAEVERDSPNVFADQVELFANNTRHLENIEISVNCHNDRGCAVAATELAQLAGATRVRGCLFGLGERAGSADIITLALNCYSTGIDPQLNLSNLPQIINDFEGITHEKVDNRQPYAGEHAFSAFVSHHQYAIDQAYQRYHEQDDSYWRVPYLPMDPAHIGRGDTQVIRVSQLSGRTGIAQVLKKYHGLRLPKAMQYHFSEIVKQQAAIRCEELSTDDLWQVFSDYYFNINGKFTLKSVHFEKSPEEDTELLCRVVIDYEGDECEIEGLGKGASDSLVSALAGTFNYELNVEDYRQHSLGTATNANAVSYVLLNNNGKASWGVGIDNDATLATLRAIICALNLSLIQ